MLKESIQNDDKKERRKNSEGIFELIGRKQINSAMAKNEKRQKPQTTIHRTHYRKLNTLQKTNLINLEYD